MIMNSNNSVAKLAAIVEEMTQKQDFISFNDVIPKLQKTKL